MTGSVEAPDIAVEVRDLTQRYGDLTVLDHASCRFEAGRTHAILGPSGSGKSTLLAAIGLARRPTGGEIILLGEPVRVGSRHAQRRRRASISWITQQPSLLPGRSALENLTAAAALAGIEPRRAVRLGEAALSGVGLAGRLHVRATDLSGGEQQRVVVARALSLCHPIVLADEPTASLDRANADLVAAALLASRPSDTTVIVATHDTAVAARCDHVWLVRDGVVDRDR